MMLMGVELDHRLMFGPFSCPPYLGARTPENRSPPQDPD